MKFATAALALVPILGANAVKILQVNDDGWAEQYLRALNNALRKRADYNVVLSAPAENKSGTGSSDDDPIVRDLACQYNSCLAGSGPTGTNATDPTLNWVNSFPVTAARYGIEQFGPRNWGVDETPDLCVTGPNVGSNLWLSTLISGTVGSACYCASDASIPAIAFSGASTGTLAWNSFPYAQRSLIYAELAAILVDRIIASGTPYLPENVFLNVNFPDVNDNCATVDDFSWVLTRVNPGFFSPDDVEWCGESRLPTEFSIVNSDGCYISISVGNADDKSTENDVSKQKAVLDKLSDMLVCV